MKEEFCKDYKPPVEDNSAKNLSTEGKGDGQKQFFTDEYKNEGAFLINRKVTNGDDGEVELKTSVKPNDTDNR